MSSAGHAGREPGLSPLSAADHARTRSGPLIGRARELAALDAALADARAGAGGLALIEGAAGLGKSRLVVEAIARARRDGMQVLRARASTTEREFAFGVALQLVEPPLARAGATERLALLSGAAALVEPLLDGDRAGGEDPGQPTSFSVLHGLYWLIVNLTERGPLLLCVDDLHWSDESSLRFLLHLAGRLEELPLALVAAARPRARRGESEALGRVRASRPALRLELAELDAGGVAALVRASLPRADAEFCAACAEVTRGNPFYVHEVLRALGDEKLAPTAAQAQRLRELGSASIGRAALVRLARVGHEAAALAQALAVLGDGAALRRAAALARLDLEHAGVAAGALAAEELVFAGASMSFVHPLLRQAVYDDMPPVQRGLLHGHAARLLADEGAPPEQVAGHLLVAPAAAEPWVVRALLRAARRAQSRGAPEPATRYLVRALDEPPGVALRAELLVQLGAAEAAAGMPQAIEHLTAALELRADPAERGEAQRLLGRALADRGRGAEAAAVLERALDELDGAHEELSYALLADYVATAVFEPGLRQRAMARIAPLLDSAPAGGTAAERALLASLAMRSAQEGRPVARSIELADRAWRDGALLADEGPDGTGWLKTTWALDLAEDYPRAERVTQAAIDAARDAGSVGAFATASYFHGDARFRRGRLTDAQADAEQAIETRRAGWRRYLAAAYVLEANVLIERDQLDDAEAALTAAEDYGHGAMLEIPWVMHARGRLALARSRPQAALDLFTQAGEWLVERLAVHHTVLPWRCDAAHAALAVGDEARARTLIAPVCALAERADAEIARGCAQRVLGLIEGGEAGIELLEQASDRLGRTEARLEHAYALTDLGAAMRRAGRRAQAREPLRRALDLAHAMDAVTLARRARDELAATGARRGREQRGGADALTPSERRVGDLAAKGLTYAQIAQALFVTPKTVEYHLRHVYQKLAIPGRGSLAVALAERDARDRAAAGDDVAPSPAVGPARPRR